MNVRDANDFFTLLHWLGVDPLHNGLRRTDDMARKAFSRLADRACAALQAVPPHAGIETLVRALAVLREVTAERAAQDAKWGEQNHPDGTGENWVAKLHPALGWSPKLTAAQHAAWLARVACQRDAKKGTTTWTGIALEEVAEAFAETDTAALRGELVQIAAVMVAWIEAIDRRWPSEPCHG